MSNVNFKIVDIFESMKNELFIPQEYLSVNKNLKNFTTNNKFSMSIPLELNDFGIDGDAEIIKSIKNEMNQHIYKSKLVLIF